MAKRLKNVKKACEQRGATISTPKRGSHWKVSLPECRPYTLPAHNGAKTEVSDRYIAGLCRNFGWDVEEFKADL